MRAEAVLWHGFGRSFLPPGTQSKAPAVPSVAFSRTKCWRMPICLLRVWNAGLEHVLVGDAKTAA